MKTRNLFATALAILALPAIASAEDYGTAGQLEAGGFFGIASQTETIKPEGGGPEGENKFTVMQIDPTVGYFVSNGFELLGTMHVQNISADIEGFSDTITLNEIGLGAGAGYFVNVGVARIGPQAILRFGTSAIAVGDFEQADGLFGAQVGGFAKVPIGGGGVLAAGLVVDYDTIARTNDDGTNKFDSEGTNTQFGARIGYFVFF